MSMLNLRSYLLAIGLTLTFWGSGVRCRAQTTEPFRLPPPVDAQEADRLAWYEYDANLPLNADLKKLDITATANRFLLDYDSVHDQRVSAIISLPKQMAAPYPAVILVHGSGGSKNTDYIRAISETLTGRGYATLSIDTQYHGDRKRPGRSGEIHMPDSYTMRDAWVQSVIDLRRAVDYLESRPDIDHARIGYLGFSQGGMLGSVFGGVEPRVAAFCLAVPGGGLMEIVKHIDEYPVLKAHWPIHVTPDVMKTIEEVANITDPIYYVGRIGPRPLLILVANNDEIIPPAASEALIKAAHATPDQVKRVASGHVLNPNVLFDIRNFFTAQFGNRTIHSLIPGPRLKGDGAAVK
jgi:dienelactone hydrolase